jgi:hypothetical protein
MPHRRHRHQHNPNHKQARQRQPRFPNVSPYELIREDFSRMLLTKRLRTTDDAAEWILMQSVEGHAQMGHGAFAGRRFPNTEMEDIVAALGREPKLVAQQRQGLIDEVCDWAQRAVNGNGPKTLVNGNGEGLIGCGLLRHFEVDSADVLRGLYLGGLRDNSEVRLEVEKRTGAVIGGGHCRFVNVEVMHEMGLDGEKLARGAHGDKLTSYQEKGLLIPDPGPAFWEDERIRYMYIRDRLGGGASDDAAITAAGMIYNLSVALGVFLADAIDTLEKFVVDYEDQDGDIARNLETNFPGLNLTLEDVYRLTWICHVPAEAEGHVPDSSLRHLLEVDKDTDQNALESHLAYLCGHAYSPLPLGHDDVPNDEFYQWLEGRVEGCPI